MPRTAGRPNLLFIMTDQQKATTLDLYNSGPNAIRTRGLRSLAESGVVFDAAYCAYPLCTPSRISMLTGRYPSSTGLLTNNAFAADDYQTIFGVAHDHGYATTLVGKDHAYASMSIGGDPGNHPAWMDHVFDRIYTAGHNARQPPEINRDLPHIERFMQSNLEMRRGWQAAVAPWNASESITARLHDVAVNYLSDWMETGREKPFAMWLSFPDPHEFYQAPRDVFESIDPKSIDLPPNWESDIENRSEFIQFMHWYFNARGVSKDTVLHLIRVYLAMCLNVDTYLQSLFSFMKSNELWDDTIVIFTSDHGDYNGEHQLVQKFNSGYDGNCRIPLLISWPAGISGGRRCSDPVNLTDLPATLCDLLGWDHFDGNQGVSFSDLLTGNPTRERRYTVVESGLPGKALSLKDIPNFPSHSVHAPLDVLNFYNPPHRWTGKLYAVRSAKMKLIVREGQKSEFYDLTLDPWETTNLYDDPTYRDHILQHHEYLAQHLTRIAYRRPGTVMRDYDSWYEAGGEKSWDEVKREHGV